MKDTIQNKINELLIKIRALDIEKLNKNIEEKENELNIVKLERSGIIQKQIDYQEEIDFLEKMFIKYKELEGEG